MRRILIFVLFLWFVSVHVLAQAPTSDPQAAALAAKALTALTGGVPISDVTLTGTVARVLGSDARSGTITLLSMGMNQSRVDFSFNGSLKRTDIRTVSSGLPSGTWTDKDGAAHSYSLHNCWTEASWFFPATSSLSGTSPDLIFSYVGQETRGTSTVQHLRTYRYVPSKNPKTTDLTEHLSMTDFYLSGDTLLPVALAFNVHPDDDAERDIPVEIQFSNYQNNNGVMVPMHLQQFLNGGPVIDIVLTAVTLNSAISETNFQVK